MIAIHDRLVHLRAAVHVVGLDREHFLQGVRSTVGLERPHFHFAEALAAELRLATQRLLRDERVRARGTRVHLVVDQMVELQHVHVAHGHFAFEALARTTVVQHRLTGKRQIGELQHVLDLFLGRTVEHRRCHRHAVTQVARQGLDLVIVQRVDIRTLTAGLVVDLVQELADLRSIARVIEHATDLVTDALRCPSQVRLEDLSDVHTRRHAQRIEHDVDRRTVCIERHVFDRDDRGDHTLVAVTAGHLVARLNTTLHGEVDLHHLQHAGGEIVAGRDLGALLIEAFLELLALRLQTLRCAFDRSVRLFVLQADFEPLLTWQIGKIRLIDRCARSESLRTGFRSLAQQHRLHTLEQVVFENAALIFEVLANLFELRLFDRQRTRILLDAIAREHANVDHGAVHARRNAQRRVFHVGSLLTEDGAQQLLFRRQLRLALRSDLAHQNVARLHLGADECDACLVQLGQRDVTDVRNVSGDFFRPQLRVARNACELLDVDRREAIVMNDTLRDQDGVFEVVAVPGHERDQQVLAQRQLTQVSRRTVRQHVAARDHIARLHQRTLVDAGVLVGTGVLGQRVDVDARFGSRGFLVVYANHDT